MLAGYTRMTYSLVVIVMETTQSINIFIPVTVTIYTSVLIGDLFTRGLYDRAVRGKQMPMITDQIHDSVKYVRAEEIMSTNVVSLTLVDSVSNIQKALETSHHGFPVLNMSGRVVGLIPKNFLVILLEKKAFYGSKTMNNFIDSSHGGPFNKKNSI